MGKSSGISKRVLGLAAAAVLLVPAACGPSGPRMERVTGEVLYQGKPVAGAKVMFNSPASARTASGTTDAAGQFTLTTFAAGDGAVVAEHRVAISAFSDEAVAKMSPAQQEALARGHKVPGSGLPTKYASVERSGLSAVVETGGKNHFRFDLTD